MNIRSSAVSSSKGLKGFYFRYNPLFLAILLTAPAIGAPPPAIEPGRLERDLKPRPEPEAVPAEPRRQPAQPQTTEQDRQARFILNSIELSGNLTLPTSQFEDIWADDIGKEVSLARIKDMASEITVRYRNAGYVLCQAIVPAQQITDGKVELTVVEGYVASVLAEEGKTLEGMVARYAAHIPAIKPLQVAELQNWLLLINDLPGVDAQSVLKPSKDIQGAADLTLKVQRQAYSGMFSGNNRAGAYYQDWSGDLSAAAYNQLGWDEEISLRAAFAGDAAVADDGGYRNLGLGLGLPLGAEGGKLTFNYERTLSVPGYDIEGVGYEGHSQTAAIGYEYPFERTRGRTLHGRLKLDINENGLDLRDATVYEDHVSALRAGLRLDWAGLGGITLLDGEASVGLPLFDASAEGDDELSRADGDGEFYKLYLDLVHIRPLPWEGGKLRADITAQTSDRKLLSNEEIGFGGPRIGRGYDGSEITGDQGAGLGIEVEQLLPYGIRAYGFYDIGMVRNKSDRAHQSLASAGIGGRGVIRDRIQGQLEFAVPLTRPVEAVDPGGGDDWRVFLNLSVGF